METQASPEQESGSGKAERSEWKCPECGSEVDKRGAIGHLRFQHDISNNKAKQIYSNSKNSSNETGGSVGATSESRVSEGGGPVVDGETSRYVQDRLKETADTVAAKEMIHALSDDGGGGGGDVLDQIVKMQEVGLIGGEDKTDEEVKQEIAELKGQLAQMERQQGQQPAADGGETGPMDVLVREGVTDSEAWESALEVEAARRGLTWQHRALDLLERADADSLIQGVSSVFDVLSQVSSEGQSGAKSEAETQVEGGDASQSSLKEKYGPGDAGEIELADDAFDDGGESGDE